MSLPPRAIWLTAAGIAVVLVLAACRPAPGGSGSPITDDEAARLVLGQQARFAGIGPLDPDLIGQAAWYEVVETDAGWEVSVRIGWGDCPAGCISEHTWRYAVTRDGSVTLLGEEGDPLAGTVGLRGVVLSGPVCPVLTDPPDPACADRPVAGAVLLVLDADGREIARVTSAADGGFSIELAPGGYHLVPQPVDGLMGTPAPTEFTVDASGPMTELTVSYDTGIR